MAPVEEAAKPGYILAVMHQGKKTFTVLENNPEVMTPLAHRLGIDPSLQFHDIYSLTDPDLLSLIPRPVLALLVIIPMTPAWDANRLAEDGPKDDEEGWYEGKGPEEPVIWFKQTIGHACGSIGLIHCLLNGPASAYIQPNTFLSRARDAVVDLPMKERAQWLYDSKEFETAHQSVATLGDTAPPSASDGDKLGQHFVAFVKGLDGCLYELEGSRKGPLNRGKLGEDEDVLSSRALELGLGRVIKLQKEWEGYGAGYGEGEGGGDLRFSAIALAKS